MRGAGMTAPSIRVQNLGIVRRGRTVLRDLTTTFAAGRLYWITGENGSGKTSLLRVLAGLAAPNAGQVEHVTHRGQQPAIRYYTPSMVAPPAVQLSEWLVLTRAFGVSPALLALQPTLDPGTRLDRLSTGEGKRLLLVAMLASSAPFVILDEPFEHLSPNAKDTLFAALLEIATSAAVVVSTNQAVPAGQVEVLRFDDVEPKVSR